LRGCALRMKWRQVFGAALVALVLLAASGRADEDDITVTDDEDEEEQMAFLIARKFLSNKELVVGKNVTVVVELFNAGSRCATHLLVSSLGGGIFEVEVDACLDKAN
jgi:Translocon-associated protein beta (TRAPB)